MVPKCLAVLVAATSVLAKTPPGFTPSSETDLIVDYNAIVPQNGQEVGRNDTTTAPRIGTADPLRGTSYAVLMIDLDIPTASPPQTDTLLHWLQTGLTPPDFPTMITTSAGIIMAYLLEVNNTTPTSEPIVPYFGPNPPARVPLTHRYTQLLVDTSEVTAEGVEVLRAAAGTLRGFDAAAVLEEAGLGGRVVAGNWFTVTNGGGSVGNGTGNGTGAVGGGNGTVFAGAAGGVVRPVGVGGLVAVGVVVGGMVVLGL